MLPAESHTTMWLPDAAARTPTRPSRLTTMRASAGTTDCSGLLAPRARAHDVSSSSKVVTSGSSINSAQLIASSVMWSASRS